MVGSPSPVAWMRAEEIAVQAARGSHFLKRFQNGTPTAETLVCTVVTPLADEVPEPANPELRVVPGQGSYGPSVLPYMTALGPVAFDAADAPPETRAITQELEAGWRTLVKIAGADVQQPWLRILIKHYPRPELPGRCVAVHTTVYTIPDGWLDRRKGPPDGVVFEIRKTYQLDGAAPRLIEAQLELQEDFGLRGNKPTGCLLPRDSVGAVGSDGAASVHFEHYGAARRAGILWVERSAAVGPSDPWCAAYRVSGGATTFPLTPAILHELLRIVGRA